MPKDHIDELPTYTDATRPWIKRRRRTRLARFVALAFAAYLATGVYRIASNTAKPKSLLSITELNHDYATCAKLRRVPTEDHESRVVNKRWVNGTKPLLIRNATVWTGEPTAGSTEEEARSGKAYTWITSDIYVDLGLIQKIAPNISGGDLPQDTEVFEAHGRQLTAGIVDMHSHAGLGSVGNLQDDTNELSSDITPFVQSLDGLDPLQPEIQWIKSGGVTTSLILPGSGNNMGGEAFVVKFAVGKDNGRAEISQEDMSADPDKNWRYMKMACGENPKRVYGKYGEHGPFSRLGESWEFRHALEQATNYVSSQDEWCAAADAVGVENMNSYLPQELKWESLGAVLRGQVRINTHCYTIPDLEAFVRHTNEFKFRIYAFHHAHQTYLIPEVLKRAWGGTPAAALFADNMYYKVEAYTASEKAGKILYENGITPTYVSDNPVLNSQHVILEAAKAYGNGLPYHVALAGVTSASAELLGLGHRVGKIVEGFDADIVVWDSDPLSAGATPVQVWIDGAPQFKDPVALKKPVTPPLEPNVDLLNDFDTKVSQQDVIFTGISKVFLDEMDAEYDDGVAMIVRNGDIVCLGKCTEDLLQAQRANIPVIHLKDGQVTPPFTAFGSALGLIEIDAESDTHDGRPPKDGVSRAVDGLLFGGKQLTRAYEHGVTRAISAPTTSSIDGKGVSVGFFTEARSAAQKGAIWQDEIALHYPLTLQAKGDSTPSISSAVGLLRGKLLQAIQDFSTNSSTITGKEAFEETSYLKRVVNGSLPLVLSAHSADTIATIIRLKSEVEAAIKSSISEQSHGLRLIVIGGAESHLVATELAAAKVAVVLAPLLPHAQSWDQRRGLTGAPLTKGTSINALLDAGVLLGIGVEEIWETRDLGLLAGIAYANSEGRLSFKDALSLVGPNFEKMLGLDRQEGGSAKPGADWAVWEGSPLEIGGKLRGLRNAAGVVTTWQ